MADGARMDLRLDSPTHDQATPTPLQEALDRFLRSVPGVTGVVIGDNEGLPIASHFRGAAKVELIAVTAMAALAMRSAVSVARNLNLTETSSATLEGPAWKIIVSATPSHRAVVLVMTQEPTNLGLLKLSLPKLLDQVDRQLDLL